jgi:uncharacterized phage protein (TIGR01671 family)
MENRIIKFRTWDNAIKKMLYSGNHPADDNSLFWSNAYWQPLMQYTGLKDKEWNLIFQGDFLKHQKYTYQVKWTDRWYKAYDIHNSERNFELACLIFDKECAEIIGNIYENYDLIDNK